MRTRFMTSALSFFVCSFTVSAAIFYAVSTLLLQRGFGQILFISRSPSTLLMYLALLCLAYSLLAAGQSRRIARGNAQDAALISFICILSAPFVASPVFGVLTEIPGVYSGCYPGLFNSAQQLGAGGILGVIAAFMYPVLLFPYNIICAAVGIPGTIWLSRRLHGLFSRDAQAGPPWHEESQPAIPCGL